MTRAQILQALLAILKPASARPYDPGRTHQVLHDLSDLVGQIGLADLAERPETAKPVEAEAISISISPPGPTPSFLLYKCRLCGEEFDDGHAPDGDLALMIATGRWAMPADWRGVKPALVTRHACPPGMGSGVADLVGAVPDRMPDDEDDAEAGEDLDDHQPKGLY